MKKSDITQFPHYFDYYINLNEDLELSTAFCQSLQQLYDLDMQKLNNIGLKVYAQGKWTLNKIIQHITDWERIWCYRTILAVRNEGTIPSGLDYIVMVENSNADQVPLELLISELRSVRLGTKALYETFNDEILASNCRFDDNEMSVLAMGFNIIGHQIHHFHIIEERYFPLSRE